ncbi:MAG: sigma-70 family RNA polymerase sigma factor [Pirellulales bacterium]|nr:sigma-70 family RNA polymerase sigma factor [Pirellulales bacterium]
MRRLTTAEAYDQTHKVQQVESGATDLDALVASHGQQVARLVARLVDRREDVEDLVQETFLATIVHRASFRGDCQPSTWLARIAVNRCRSYHRWRRVRRFVRFASDEDNHASTPDPGKAIETGEEIRRAVQRLPGKYREVIVLRYFEGLSVDELVDVLGLRRTMVEKRLSRARQKLKETLTSRLD